MSGRKERKLGFFEAYAASSPTCVVSMVAVLSPSRGGDANCNKADDDVSHRLTDDAFHRGVDFIARRHPHLRSVLVRKKSNDQVDNGELYLRLLPDSDFRLDPSHKEIVSIESDNGWQSVVQQESNIGFDLQGTVPYWRVVLIRGPTSDVLLIKYHHCIGDGTSGYILINDIISKAFVNTSSVGEALPLLPHIDELCFPLGRSDEDEAFTQNSVEVLRNKRVQWFPRLKYEGSPPRGNKHSILYCDGTEENLTALLKKCRSMGVTIGSVLGAATFFAVAKMNQGQNPGSEHNRADGKPFRFDFDMDVNLRKRLPDSLGNDHVGAHIGMMSFNLLLTPTTRFWDFVTSFRDAIDKGLNEKQHFHYLEVNRRLDDMLKDKPLEKKAWKKDDGHENDMNFSNITRYPFSPEYGPVGIEKIYCVGGGWCPLFGAYVFLIPSVHYLNFSCVYEKAKLNDSVASEFFNSVCSLTERASTIDDSFTLEEYMLE